MADGSPAIFLRLIAELKKAAEAQGEATFADALRDCLRTEMTNPQCPMARLLFATLERLKRRGTPPGASDRLCPSQSPPGFFDRPPAEVLDDLHAIMKLDAALHMDWGFLQALRTCEALMGAEGDNVGPIRRVLHLAEPQVPPESG